MGMQSSPEKKSINGKLGHLSRTKIVILVVAWLISIFIGNRIYLSATTPTQVVSQSTPVAVRRGTIAATVNAAGSVVSTKQAKLTFGSAGTLAELPVAVGDSVKAGQPLAKLDTTTLEIALSGAQSDLRTAEIKQQQLKNGATSDERAAAQSAYDSAFTKYNDVVNGATAAEIRAAEQTVSSAQNTLLTAQNNLATLKAKPSADDVKSAEIALEQAKDSRYSSQISRDLKCGQTGASSPECASANASVMSAEMSVQSAQLKLDIAKRPATAEDIAAAEKSVQSAQAGLDVAQTKLNDLKAGPTATDLSSAKASLDSAQATLNTKLNGATAEDIALGEETVKKASNAVKTAELNLKNATIVAPFDGVVSAVGANVGEQVGSGTAMITLVNPKAIRVDVTVSETDITQVTLNSAATVTFDALPNKTFQGNVIAVSPSATVSQGVVNYSVSISIDPGDTNIPAGLTASANIITSQKDNVLMVPNRAITLQGRNRVVTVPTADGKEETRQVQIGMSNDTYTEIVSGLNEGEQVLIKATTASSSSRVGGVGNTVNMGGGNMMVAPAR